MDPNMMRTAQERETIKQLAYQYIEFPEQIIAQGIGRPPDLRDLKEFMQTALGELLGRMYSTLLQCEGQERADMWSKMVLGMAGTWVRSQGFDVVLKFDVNSKNVPNTLNKKKDAELEQKLHLKQLQKDLNTVPPCECKLEPDGRCPTCAPALTEQLERTFEPFFKMQEKKQTCRACNDSQIDFAMAGLVPRLLKICEEGTETAKQTAGELLNMLYAMASSMGAKIPLTEKVWSEGMAALALKATPAPAPSTQA